MVSEITTILPDEEEYFVNNGSLYPEAKTLKSIKCWRQRWNDCRSPRLIDMTHAPHKAHIIQTINTRVTDVPLNFLSFFLSVLCLPFCVMYFLSQRQLRRCVAYEKGREVRWGFERLSSLKEDFVGTYIKSNVRTTIEHASLYLGEWEFTLDVRLNVHISNDLDNFSFVTHMGLVGHSLTKGSSQYFSSFSLD